MCFPDMESLIQPALTGLQIKNHDLRRVVAAFCLIEFKKHLSVGKLAENLDLASRCGHTVADALALAVLEILGLVHNADAFLQRNLELILHASYGTALEDIIGNDTHAGKFLKKLSQYGGVVVDPFEKDGLILHHESHFAEDPDHLGCLGSDLPGMVELGDNVNLLFVGKLPEDILKFGILKNAVRKTTGILVPKRMRSR